MPGTSLDIDSLLSLQGVKVDYSKHEAKKYDRCVGGILVHLGLGGAFFINILKFTCAPTFPAIGSP